MSLDALKNKTVLFRDVKIGEETFVLKQLTLTEFMNISAQADDEVWSSVFFAETLFDRELGKRFVEIDEPSNIYQMVNKNLSKSELQDLFDVATELNDVDTAAVIGAVKNSESSQGAA